MNKGEVSDLVERVIQMYFLQRTENDGVILSCSKEQLHMAIVEVAGQTLKSSREHQKDRRQFVEDVSESIHETSEQNAANMNGGTKQRRKVQKTEASQA